MYNILHKIFTISKMLRLVFLKSLLKTIKLLLIFILIFFHIY